MMKCEIMLIQDAWMIAEKTNGILEASRDLKGIEQSADFKRGERNMREVMFRYFHSYVSDPGVLVS